jgi:DNA-binding HxlR family transcriptional regulator
VTKPKRTYDQFCGLATALDVVGERWTLLIVRDLALGPQRYSDLLEGLPGIGTGLLAERLRHLETEGLVRKAQLPPPANVTVYELTADGRLLADALLPIAMWGVGRLAERAPRGALYRADWLLFSVRARFDPAQSSNVHEIYEFRVNDQVVHVRVDDGTVEAYRGPAPVRADIVVEADAQTFYALSTGRMSVEAAVGSGKAKVEGSQAAIQHSLDILAGGGRPPNSARKKTAPNSRRRARSAP